MFVEWLSDYTMWGCVYNGASICVSWQDHTQVMTPVLGGLGGLFLEGLVGDLLRCAVRMAIGDVGG